jgi:hypothetical protein
MQNGKGRFGGKAAIGIFIGGVVVKQFLDRRKARAILMVVQPPHQVIVQRTSICQGLRQTQPLLVGRDGDMAIGKVDEVHCRIAGDHFGKAARHPLGIVGSIVLPVGKGALDGGVGFLAQKALAKFAVAGNGNLGPAIVDKVVDLLLVRDLRNLLKTRIFAKEWIIQVFLGW